MNKEAIKKTYDAIRVAMPERVIMNRFMETGSSLCSTAACIAGWATIVLHETHDAWKDLPWRVNPEDCKFNVSILKYYTEREAEQAFELTSEQALQLFYMKFPKEDFAKVLSEYGVTRVGTYDIWKYDALTYFDSFPPVYRKQCALNVLDILLHTEVIDWPKAMDWAAVDCGWPLLKTNRELKHHEQKEKEQIEQTKRNESIEENDAEENSAEDVSVSVHVQQPGDGIKADT